MLSPWIRQTERNNQPDINLFCIPHAGGSASLYKHWPTLLPESIHPLIICLPGREQRINDPMPDTMADLVEQICLAIQPIINQGPWAMFGHSMGATLAHEVSNQLVKMGYTAPSHLILSARKPAQYHTSRDLHLKSEEDLCEEIIRLGGTPPELLALPEVREIFLPAIRSDYKILETWDTHSAAIINAPISVFRGLDDTELTLQQALGWKKWHNGNFNIKDFPGGHFYLSDSPQKVTDEIKKILLGS